LPGFTFVGRDPQIAGFRELLERPQGELLVVTGAEGSGKSHLLRRLRREADLQKRHFVQFNDLGFLPDADLRHYSIIASLAAGHRGESRQNGERAAAAELFPNPREFLGHLMTVNRRPPCEKLLRVFSAASAHLPDDARLVLLLDLGRAKGEEAFPVEFLARRLPEKVKLVVAVAEAPPSVGELKNTTVISGLPPLDEADLSRLLEFHLSRGAVNERLVGAAVRKFGGAPMLTDLAAKLVVGAEKPAEAIASLPADPAALFRELLGRLDDDQRFLALSLARVPSGVDVASLRALTDFSDGDLRRLLRSDEIRNIVITQRGARGPRARLFHELLSDQVLADATEDSADAREFHRRAASFFLGAVEQDSSDVDALCAHAYHLRLSGDRRQFIHDFPRTYKVKHSFGLFQHLADGYKLLLQYCDELGEASISRPACLANLGRVLQELGQNDEALGYYRQALEAYQGQEDATGTAEQLANIASVLQALGQLDQALEHLQRAAALDEGANNGPALATDLNNLGILCQQLQRHDEALDYHQRALDLHRELGNDVGVANQLANMAAIHRARGDLEAARDSYQKAWIIDNRTKSTLAEVADLCNLGLIFQELGDMEKAMTCYQQAIELDRSIADLEGEADHLRSLASMHERAAQHGEASRLLQRAVELDRSIGNTKGEAMSLLALADVCRATGELSQAAHLLRRATVFCAKLGDTEAEEAIRRTLESVQAQARPEAVEEATEGPGEAAPAGKQAVERERAGGGVWANLQLVDDEQGGAPPAAAAVADQGLPASPGAPANETPAAGPDESTIERLRRECDEARRRVAELEAELETYRQIVEELRKIVG